MEDSIKLAIVIHIGIDLVYLYYCILTITRALKHKNSSIQKNKLLAIGAIGYSGITSLTIIVKYLLFRNITAYFLFANMIFEILFILIVQYLTIENRKIKIVFTSLLLICLIFGSITATKSPNSLDSNVYFLMVTFISLTIAFTYLNQSIPKITRKFLYNEVDTLIILGLFYGNSIYLPTAICTVSLIILSKTESLNQIPTTNPFLTGLLIFDSIGRFCYVIIFYFLSKAFIWKKLKVSGT